MPIVKHSKKCHYLKKWHTLSHLVATGWMGGWILIGWLSSRDIPTLTLGWLPQTGWLSSQTILTLTLKIHPADPPRCDFVTTHHIWFILHLVSPFCEKGCLHESVSSAPHQRCADCGPISPLTRNLQHFTNVDVVANPRFQNIADTVVDADLSLTNS